MVLALGAIWVGAADIAGLRFREAGVSRGGGRGGGGGEETEEQEEEEEEEEEKVKGAVD